MADKEYKIKINTQDVERAEKIIKKTGGELKKINDNEIIVKLDYDDSGIKKVIQKLYKESPTLAVQIEYEINKEALEKETAKLKNMSMLIDESSIIKQINIISERYSKMLSEEAPQKEIDKLTKKMANMYATLFEINGNSDSVLGKLSKNAKELYEDLPELGKGHSLSLVSEKQYNDQLKKVDILKQKRKELLSAGANETDVNKTKTAMEDILDLFSKYANAHNDKHLSSFWDDIAQQIANGDEGLKSMMKDLGLITEEAGELKIVTEGMVKSGGLIGDKNVLLATKKGVLENRINETVQLKDKLEQAYDAGINVARILSVVYDEASDTFVELQEKVSGNILGSIYGAIDEGYVNPDIYKATDEQILKLIEDMVKLHEIGIGIDINPTNIAYDEKKGFSFFDLDLEPGTYKDTAEFIDDVHKGIVGAIREFYEDINDVSGQESIDNFGDRLDNIFNAIKSRMSTETFSHKEIEGIIDELRSTGFHLGEAVIGGLRDGVDAHSNSRESERVADDVANGFNDQLESRIPDMVSTAQKAGKTIREAFSEAINKNPSNAKEFYEKYGTPSQALWDGLDVPAVLRELGGRFAEMDPNVVQENEPRLNGEFFKDLIDQMKFTHDQLIVLKAALVDIDNYAEGGAFRKYVGDFAANDTVQDRLNMIRQIIDGEREITEQELNNAKSLLIQKALNDIPGQTSSSNTDDSILKTDKLGQEIQETGEQGIIATDQIKEGLSNVNEETEEVTRSLSTLTEKLKYLQELKTESKFLETAEDKRIDMEEKEWDAGGKNGSQDKINQYEAHIERMETANALVDEFAEKYDKAIITMKNGEQIEIFDAQDLENISLAKNKIKDIELLLDTSFLDALTIPKELSDNASEYSHKYDDIINAYQQGTINAEEAEEAVVDLHEEMRKLAEEKGINEQIEATKRLEKENENLRQQLHAQADEYEHLNEEYGQLSLDYDNQQSHIDFLESELSTTESRLRAEEEITAQLDAQNQELERRNRELQDDNNMWAGAAQDHFEAEIRLQNELDEVLQRTENAENENTNALQRQEVQVREASDAVEELIENEQKLSDVQLPAVIPLPDRQAEARKAFYEDIKPNGIFGDGGAKQSGELIEYEAKELDILESSAEGAAKSKEHFAVANAEVLQSILSSLTAINSEGDGFKHLNKIINNLANNKDDRIIKLITNLKLIREVLSKPLEDNAFLNVLRDIANQADALNDLATILKATKKEIEDAKNVQSNDKSEKKPKEKGESEEAQLKRYIALEKQRLQVEKELETARKSGLSDESETIKFLEEKKKLIESQQEGLNVDREKANIQLNIYKQELALIKQKDNAEKANSNTQINLLRQVNSWIAKNTIGYKAYKQQLDLVVNTLSSGAKLTKVELDGIASNFKDITLQAEKAGKVGKGFTEVLKSRYEALAAYTASFTSVYDIIRYGRNLIDMTKDFDTALTEMRKVSDESVSTLRDFQKESFAIASSVGSTADVIQDSVADWMRLGESLEQAKESAKDASILFNVSEFSSIDEATTSLVAMSQAYSDMSKLDIIDKLNNIGNNFSISTDKLATGLQNAAAVLQTQGNDIDESIALLTAANSIVQDISKASTGVRTISLRIAGTEEAKDELKELGEDVEDYIVQTSSKTQETIKNFTAVASNMGKGIDVLNENGNLRNTYDILLDISKVYKEIQEEDKKYGTNRANALVEFIAGKNRSNIAASILNSPDLLEKVYTSSKNSEGSAMEENEKYLDSIEGRLNKLKTTWQGIWASDEMNVTMKSIISLVQDVLDSGDVNKLVSGIKEILETVKSITEHFQTIKTIFLGIVGAKGIGAIKSVFSEIQGFMKSVDEFADIGNKISETFTIKADIDNGKDKLGNKGLSDLFNTTLDDNVVETYRASLQGLTADQAAYILQVNGATKAQAEQVLVLNENTSALNGYDVQQVKASINNTKWANSIKVINAEQMKQIISTKILTSEQAQELVSNLKLKIGEDGNYYSTQKLTRAKVQLALMGMDVDRANKAELLSALNLTKGYNKLSGVITNAIAKTKLSAKDLGNIATIAFTALLTAYMTYKNAQQEVINSIKEISSQYVEAKNTMSGYRSEIEDLHEKLSDTKTSTDELEEATSRLYEIQNDIIGNYGEQAAGLDLINGKYEEQLSILEKINKQQQIKYINDINSQETAGVKAMNAFENLFAFWGHGIKLKKFGQDIINNQGLDNALNELIFGNQWNGENLGYEYFGSTLDAIERQYKEFGDSINITSNKAVNDMIDSLEGFEVVGNKIQIKGNVDDVIGSIERLQFELSESGYTDVNLNRDLTSVLKKAKNIQDAYGETIQEVTYGEIQSSSDLLDYYNKLEDAYNNYSKAKEKNDADSIEKTKDEYLAIINDLEQSEVSDKYVDYLESMHDDVADIISNWKFEFEIVPSLEMSPNLEHYLSSYSSEKIISDYHNWINGTGDISDYSAEILKELSEVADIAGKEVEEFVKSINNVKSFEKNKAQSMLTNAQAYSGEALAEEYDKLRNSGLDTKTKAAIRNGSIQTTFGNVDMNNRQIIEYNDEYLKKHKEALQSYSNYDEDRKIIETYYDYLKRAVENGESAIDSVYGGSDAFWYQGKEHEIAFTPILQTESGEPIMLSSTEINEYIQSIIDKVGAHELITPEKILAMDAEGTGYEVGGQIVKGMVAAVDDYTGADGAKLFAADVGEIMHYTGDQGAIEQAKQFSTGLSANLIQAKKEYDAAVKAFEDYGLTDNDREITSKTYSYQDKNGKTFNLTYIPTIKDPITGQIKELEPDVLKSYLDYVMTNAVDENGNIDWNMAQLIDSDTTASGHIMQGSSILQGQQGGYDLDISDLEKRNELIQKRADAFKNLWAEAQANGMNVQDVDEAFANGLKWDDQRIAKFISGLSEDETTALLHVSIDEVSEVETEEDLMKLIREQQAILNENALQLKVTAPKNASEAIDEMANISKDWGNIATVYDTTVKQGKDASSADIASVNSDLGGVTFNDNSDDTNAMSNAIEAYNRSLIDNKGNVDELQKSTNKLVTAYIDQTKVLDDLDDGTKQKYIDELKLNGVENAEQVINTRLTATYKRQAEALKNLSKSIADNREALDKGADSEGFDTAVGNIKGDVKDLLALYDENGVKTDWLPDLSNEFITENLQDIYAATEGDIEALGRLQKEAAKEYVLGLKVDPDVGEEASDVLNEINALIDAYPIEDIEVGTSLDTNPLIQGLNAMVDAGKITRDSMNNILAGIGVKPVVKGYERIKVTTENAADLAGRMVSPNASGVARQEALKGVSNLVDSYVNVPIIGYVAASSPAGANYVAPRSTNSSSPGNNSSPGGDGSDNKSEETFDWIEVTIQRIEEEIARLEEQVGNTYTEWINRNKALVEEMKKTAEEIEVQRKAAKAYEDEAGEIKIADYVVLDEKESKGLNDDQKKALREAKAKEYINKIQNGVLDIETIENNEDLVNAINKYRDAWEKHIKAQDAVQTLTIKQGELAKQYFDMAKEEYQEQIDLVQTYADLVDKRLNRVQEQGYFASQKYYKQLTDFENKEIEKLKEQLNAMIARRNEAIASGKIKEGSTEWHNMGNEIMQVVNAIEEATTQLVTYAKEMRQLKWDVFDYTQSYTDQLTQEADFLIDLLDNQKLYEENGQFNARGWADAALHTSKYNVEMHKALLYAKERAKIEEESAKDPANKDLIERRQELLKLQQESITAAYAEKDAIKSLVEEGISLFLEQLQKVIDEYKEAQKDAKD